jgi:DnaJ-class molecular chaperone
MPTHYEVLDVDQNASEQDIKKSYRKLSLQYHPDRNGGDAAATEKYKQINEAHEILSDQQKREQYNMELKFGQGGGHMNMSADMGDINNMFNMMFGGGGGFPGMGGFPGGPGVRVFHSSSGFPGGGFPGHPGMDHFFQQISKPPPIVKHVQITLEQAYTGATITVEIEKQVTKAMGRIVQIETINLQIPQGIEENEVMILREHGHVLNEDVKGDLKITFEITNGTIFKRHGTDLIYNKELTLKESLCGFSFEISHINGKVLNMNNLSNSAIIKPNYRKVVPGLGMVKNGQTGNLIIEMSVIFPDSLTKEQIEKIRDIL